MRDTLTKYRLSQQFMCLYFQCRGCGKFCGNRMGTGSSPVGHNNFAPLAQMVSAGDL